MAEGNKIKIKKWETIVKKQREKWESVRKLTIEIKD